MTSFIVFRSSLLIPSPFFHASPPIAPWTRVHERRPRGGHLTNADPIKSRKQAAPNVGNDESRYVRMPGRS